MPLISVIILCGLSWAYFFTKGRKLQMAYNIQMAAYTFAQLDADSRVMVRNQAIRILDVSGPARPDGTAPIFDNELRSQYGFYALAMSNIGIEPAMSGNIWSPVRNPSRAQYVVSSSMMKNVSRELEARYRLKFDGWVA